MNKILGKTFLVLSALLIVFAILSFMISRKENSTNNYLPNEVVEEYFKKASLKDFEAIEMITIYYPNKPEPETDSVSENSSFNDTNLRRINPKYQSKSLGTKPEDVYFEWIRKGFPSMIHSSKLQIIKVNNEFVEENTAKVNVSIGNETNIKEMNWTFLLHKTNQGWKIYNTEDVEIDNLANTQ